MLLKFYVLLSTGTLILLKNLCDNHTGITKISDDVILSAIPKNLALRISWLDMRANTKQNICTWINPKLEGFMMEIRSNETERISFDFRCTDMPLKTKEIGLGFGMAETY